MTIQQGLELIKLKEGGHLDGGLYRNKVTGEKFLIKIPNTADEAKNEIIAARLYQLMDIKIPDLELIEFNDRAAIKSKWIENYSDLGNNPIPESVIGLYENFAIDAWLANWDLAGLENDNIGFVGNEAVRIDLGGSLLYRGMGELKGRQFTNHASEACSLLNYEINYNTASLFKDVTVKHFLDGVKKISNLARPDIESLIMEHAPGDYSEKTGLCLQLFERLDALVLKTSQLEHSDPEAYLKTELCGMEHNDYVGPEHC
jgi:hypothetical protein